MARQARAFLARHASSESRGAPHCAKAGLAELANAAQRTLSKAANAVSVWRCQLRRGCRHACLSLSLSLENDLGVNSSGRPPELDRGGRRGSGPKSGQRIARRFVPTSVLKARILTKLGAMCAAPIFVGNRGATMLDRVPGRPSCWGSGHYQTTPRCQELTPESSRAAQQLHGVRPRHVHAAGL